VIFKGEIRLQALAFIMGGSCQKKTGFSRRGRRGGKRDHGHRGLCSHKNIRLEGNANGGKGRRSQGKDE